jgi:hypothetical protein
MKRARPGQNQKAKLFRRLAMPARKLISAVLHRREAIAPSVAIIFDAKMRLDECAPLRLTAAHGQIGFKEESCRGASRRR